MNAILIYVVLALPATPTYLNAKQEAAYLSQSACETRAAKEERRTKVKHTCETLVIPKGLLVSYKLI